MSKVRMTNVHEALARARLADEDKGPSVTIGTRVPESLALSLDAICKRNGTTTSSFLRECARSLVADYEKP